MLEWSIVSAMCCDSVVIILCICRRRERADNAESEMEILYFIGRTGAAIYFDNDNAKRPRQQGIWSTHSSIIAKSFLENSLFAFYL